MDIEKLPGNWQSSYTYHDTTVGEHKVRITLAEDNTLYGEGDGEDGSRLVFQLEYDPKNKVLTGTWHETTSATGSYKGDAFHGSLQLLVSDTFDLAKGLWLGFNSRRDKINTGEWTLRKL